MQFFIYGCYLLGLELLLQLPGMYTEIQSIKCNLHFSIVNKI